MAQRNGVGFSYADLTNTPVKQPSATGESPVFRGPDQAPLSASSDGSPSRVILQNQHGDGIGWIDPTTGDLPRTRTYDPYGTVSSATGGDLPIGFQGSFTDPQTALVNAHARWYAPASGGFVSRDTADLPPDPVARINRYGYANASPLNYADPTGHDPAAIPIVIGGVWLGLPTLTAIATAVGPWAVAAIAAIGAAALTNLTGDFYEKFQQQAETMANASAAAVTGTITSLTEFAEALGKAIEKLFEALLKAITAALVSALASQAAAQVPTDTIEAGAGSNPYDWIDDLPTVTPPALGTTNPPLPESIPFLPNGSEVINIANPAIPGTLWQSSDGSDALNAAAVGGAAAVGAASGGVDPSGCGDERPSKGPRSFQDHELSARIVNGLVM